MIVKSLLHCRGPRSVRSCGRTSTLDNAIRRERDRLGALGMAKSTSSRLKRDGEYTILLLGDLQLGRLVDGLLPTSTARESPHTDPESAMKTIDEYFLPKYPRLKNYGYAFPWGSMLSLVRDGADLVLGNLETALTRSERKWEGKVFNYRSHPGNVRVLLEGGFGAREGRGKARGYVSLANNHTLDWAVEGLHETVKTLEDAGVRYAGAGRTKEESERPAVLHLGGEEDGYVVGCYSFSDHPSDWNLPEFNLIDYSRRSREDMKRQLMTPQIICPADPSHGPKKRMLGLKIVSLHWGPNYAWHPSPDIVSLAHYLIDECDVDIIHGHSSHHIQGVEVYRGKLVVYGCGDFVDDYAVVSGGWRNDLSAAWRVTVGERAGQEKERLEIRKLEVFPNRIKLFQAGSLEKEDEDHEWVENKFRQLCEWFGMTAEEGLGEEGQIVVDIKAQR